MEVAQVGGQRSPGQKDRSPSERSLGAALHTFLERHELACLCSLLAMLAAMALVLSHRKQLWFDELFTLIVARQPTWSEFMRAMPADGNPPLLHVIVRASIHIFGQTAFAVRLPSLTAFLLSVLLHVLVRERCGSVAGLLAVLLIMEQPGWSYAFEARPYALLLAFLLLTAVCWQRATEADRPRAVALAGLSLGVAGAILSHHVGLIEVGVPLFAAEAVRLHRTRRFDLFLYAAFLAGLPALAVTVPMMHKTHEVLLVYAGAPGQAHLGLGAVVIWLKNAWLSFPLLVDLPITLLLGLMWAAGVRPGDRSSFETVEAREEGRLIRAEDWGLGVGAALLIPVTLVVMEVATRYYNCRYGIGSIAGIAILGSFTISNLYSKDKRFQSALIVFCVTVFCVRAGHEYRTASPIEVDRDPLLSEESSDRPIVVSDALRFLPIWWYASPSERERLFYLADKSVALRYGFAVPEIALITESRFMPARVVGYAEFAASHRSFLVYMTGQIPARDLVDRLRESGYALSLVKDNGSRLYEARRIQP